jgi:hypothetical protein
MNAYDTLTEIIGTEAAYTYASTLHRRRNNPALTQAIALQSDMRNASRRGHTGIAAHMAAVLETMPLLPTERRILAQNYA